MEDGRTDGRTEKQTGRQTDRKTGGIIIIITILPQIMTRTRGREEELAAGGSAEGEDGEGDVVVPLRLHRVVEWTRFVLEMGGGLGGGGCFVLCLFWSTSEGRGAVGLLCVWFYGETNDDDDDAGWRMQSRVGTSIHPPIHPSITSQSTPPHPPTPHLVQRHTPLLPRP